jgi:hypothetical protein
MNIRKTQKEDFDQVMQIYAHARELMKATGNPTQWGDSWPPADLIRSDIEAGDSYVVEEKGEICGVFAFLFGEDPTYVRIEEGAWLNDHPYGTIHRIASSGKVKGVFQASAAYCESRIPNVRIDTHNDNRIMQHQLEKAGFVRCGIIHVDDGSARIAYQKTLE